MFGACDLRVSQSQSLCYPTQMRWSAAVCLAKPQHHTGYIATRYYGFGVCDLSLSESTASAVGPGPGVSLYFVFFLPRPQQATAAVPSAAPIPGSSSAAMNTVSAAVWCINTHAILVCSFSRSSVGGLLYYPAPMSSHMLLGRGDKPGRGPPEVICVTLRVVRSAKKDHPHSSSVDSFGPCLK